MSSCTATATQRGRELKHRWWLITFSLHVLSVRCWIIYKWSVNGLSVTTSMWFYSGLPWNDRGITYWWLIDLPRWLIPICDGKVSLHPWEFTFMSSFITVRDSLRMACQCETGSRLIATSCIDTNTPSMFNVYTSQIYSRLRSQAHEMAFIRDGIKLVTCVHPLTIQDNC